MWGRNLYKKKCPASLAVMKIQWNLVCESGCEITKSQVNERCHYDGGDIKRDFAAMEEAREGGGNRGPCAGQGHRGFSTRVQLEPGTESLHQPSLQMEAIPGENIGSKQILWGQAPFLTIVNFIEMFVWRHCYNAGEL